jgi:hypothetical protein
MATLPVYTSNTSASNPSSPRASADSFGGGRGLIALGGAVDNIGSVVDNQLRLKAEMDATAYVAEQSSKLQLDSLKQIEAMKTDGQPIDTFTDRYNQWHDEAIKPLVDNAPNGLAKNAMEEHALSIKTSFGQRAVQFQADEKIGQLKQNSINAANNIANLAYSDPKNSAEYNRQLAVLQDSSRRYMTPSESEAFITKSNSEFTTAKIRSVLETNPWEAEKMLKSQDATSHLTSESYMSLVNQAKNKQEQIQEKEIRVRAEKQKLFIEDPALYAIKSGANPTDINDIIARQKVAGVQPDNIAVIPKQQAAFAANQLNGINDVETLKGALEGIGQQYGADNYNIAMKDIKKAGLSDTTSFVAMVPLDTYKDVGEAAFQFAKNPKEITDKATSRPDVSTAKIQERISDLVSPVMEAMAIENPGGEALTANFQKNLTNVATYFVAQGDDVDTATKRAVTWLDAQYPVSTFNRRSYRLPQGLVANQIEPALEDAIDRTKFPGTEFQNDFIKRTAVPVLHPDGSKYYLKNQISQVITGSDGNVIYYPIVDIINQRSTKVKDIQQKAAQEPKIID